MENFKDSVWMSAEYWIFLRFFFPEVGVWEILAFPFNNVNPAVKTQIEFERG